MPSGTLLVARTGSVRSRHRQSTSWRHGRWRTGQAFAAGADDAVLAGQDRDLHAPPRRLTLARRRQIPIPARLRAARNVTRAGRRHQPGPPAALPTLPSGPGPPRAGLAVHSTVDRITSASGPCTTPNTRTHRSSQLDGHLRRISAPPPPSVTASGKSSAPPAAAMVSIPYKHEACPTTGSGRGWDHYAAVCSPRTARRSAGSSCSRGGSPASSALRGEGRAGPGRTGSAQVGGRSVALAKGLLR
jgi:hypothetical protein